MNKIFAKEHHAVERKLLQYAGLKRKAEVAIEKTYLSAVDYGKNGGSSNKISRPTERIALDNSLTEDELTWLNLIDEYYSQCGEQKRILIDGRNAVSHIKGKRGRPSWTDYVGQLYCEKLAEQNVEIIMPHRNTLKQWWDTIIYEILILALRKNIIFAQCQNTQKT